MLNVTQLLLILINLIHQMKTWLAQTSMTIVVRWIEKTDSYWVNDSQLRIILRAATFVLQPSCFTNKCCKHPPKDLGLGYTICLSQQTKWWAVSMCNLRGLYLLGCCLCSMVSYREYLRHCLAFRYHLFNHVGCVPLNAEWWILWTSCRIIAWFTHAFSQFTQQ